MGRMNLLWPPDSSLLSRRCALRCRADGMTVSDRRSEAGSRCCGVSRPEERKIEGIFLSDVGSIKWLRLSY